MNISYSLARPKASKSSIRIKISINGTYFFVYPGISIQKDLWCEKSKFIKKNNSNQECQAVKAKLLAAESLVSNHILEFKYSQTKISFLEFKTRVIQALNPRKSKFILEEGDLTRSSYILEFYNGMILNMESGKKNNSGIKYRPSTIKSYHSSLKVFREFQESCETRFTFLEFKQRELDAFGHFLSVNKNYYVSQQKKVLTHLKSVLNYAARLNLANNRDVKELQFRFKNFQPETIYLTESEIQEMASISSFKNKTAELARDLFLIGCSSGMRISDLVKLNDHSIIGGHIHLTQTKTTGKAVIPINGKLNTILTKYDGKIPHITGNTAWRYIKELAKELPSLNVPYTEKKFIGNSIVDVTSMKYHKLSTHTARRSFVTNELLNGNNPHTIMSIAGFKDLKSYYRYVRSSSKEAAEKCLEFWGNGIE